MSDQPTSLAEYRASVYGTSGWTPRDMLVYLMRRIDAGEIEPDHMVVCYGSDKTHGVQAAGPSIMTAIGLLETGKAYILDQVTDYDE